MSCAISRVGQGNGGRLHADAVAVTYGRPTPGAWPTPRKSSRTESAYVDCGAAGASSAPGESATLQQTPVAPLLLVETAQSTPGWSVAYAVTT
jgi:hypothetical protein